jgi:hypothetical protein
VRLDHLLSKEHSGARPRPGIQSHYVGKGSTVVAHGWNIDQLAVRRASVVSTALRGVESDRVRRARLGTLLGPEGVSASLSLGFPRQRLSPTRSVAGALVWKGPICAERLQPLEYAAGFDR